METLEESRAKILAELTSDDLEVRAEYLKLFEADAQEFSTSMAQAFMKWRTLDADLQGNENRAYISSLVFTAIGIHILSLKLFLSGHIVAAGNIFRQAVEFIALAFICSSKELGILEKFMNDRYSTSNAVRDVLRHSEKLGLKRDGVQALKDAQEFYSKFSHPTQLTLTTFVSFSGEGLYVGANFDRGKVQAYRQEVNRRVNLAKVFPNFVDGIIANAAGW